MSDNVDRRIWSFVVGGILVAACVALGIIGDWNVISCIVVAVMAFTFSSCLILKNNFILETVVDLCELGFVKMPMLIFELDLDGIIWFLVVKLVLFLLGIILAILAAIFAILVGAFLSVFVYPYALVKNFKGIPADRD